MIGNGHDNVMGIVSTDMITYNSAWHHVDVHEAAQILRPLLLAVAFLGVLSSSDELLLLQGSQL